MKKAPKLKKSRQLVEDLIDATSLAIAQRGLSGLTTYLVADLAGVGTGSVYQYFHDKEDLLNSLFDRLELGLTRTLEKQQLIVTGNDIDSLIAAMVESAAQLLGGKNTLYLELARNWQNIPMERFAVIICQWVLARLQELTPDNAGLPDDLAERIFIGFNSVLHTMVQLYKQENSTVREAEVIANLCRTVAYCLKHPAASCHAIQPPSAKAA